ncbi:MAG TPA: phosphatase PAP2 family protein [Rhizomicrobium sp.]|nr:phosphatase PAP2 family protein [Rhizomicrobium sp.]
MLLWAGVAALLIGLCCFAIDRRATHFFHDRIPVRWFRRIRLTTDYAKGARWLLGATFVLAVAIIAQAALGPRPLLHNIARGALAFLACLAVSSAVLHSIKLVFGRRRPRDELEHEFYGFRFFHYDPQHDSFPSGHAMTIMCVAVVLAGAWPGLAPLWFAVAFYLAVTRAVLNSHFLSDVFIGIAVGLIASRETLALLFRDIAQPWF